MAYIKNIYIQIRIDENLNDIVMHPHSTNWVYNILKKIYTCVTMCVYLDSLNFRQFSY
jgi:hypothetical protein